MNSLAAVSRCILTEKQSDKGDTEATLEVIYYIYIRRGAHCFIAVQRQTYVVNVLNVKLYN